MPCSELFKCRCSFSLTDDGAFYAVSLCSEHLGHHPQPTEQNLRLARLLASIHAEIAASNAELPRQLSHTTRPDLFDVLTRKPPA